MIEVFKSNQDFANVYLICRFDECILINPSHSYEKIISLVGSRTIKYILLTEVSKKTADQIGYYQSLIYLTKDQIESIKDNNITGYNNVNKAPFNLNNLKIAELTKDTKLTLSDYKLKQYLIKGTKEFIAVFEFIDLLFCGSLFDDNKLAKKASYKGAIYDLRNSIKEILNRDNNPKIYHNYNKPSLLSTEILNNQTLKNWK